MMDDFVTRFRYYDEERGRALFRTIVQWYEPFSTPYILDALRTIRQRSQRWIPITTNGKGLTRPIVLELAKLKPLFIVVSLNSSNPHIRAELMRDRTPEVAIQSLRWLREAEIPFAVSCVPWPSVPLAALKDCLRFGDSAGAESLRVSLPGYTRYNGAAAGWFDTAQYWGELVAELGALRAELEAPILFYPYLFEETRHPGPYNQARVMGVGRNSPAKAAGIRLGDIVLDVGGERVISRSHARDLLRKAARLGGDRIVLTVERDGRALLICMDDVNNHVQYGYPYATEHGPSNPIIAPLGIFMPSGFRRQTLTLLRRAIESARARSVLVATTPLMQPLLQEALRESDFFEGLHAEVHFVIPESRFLGGNIMMGDLLTNQDIIDCISEFSAAHGRPDLVCLPASMFTPVFGWLRDLNGRYYKEIERATGVPVRLIQNEPIAW